MVQDILPGIDGQAPGQTMAGYLYTELVPFDGTLYFTASDGLHGRELWRLAEPRNPPPPAVTIGGGKLKLDAKGRIKVKLTCAPADAAMPCRGRLSLATAAKIATRGKGRKGRKRATILGPKPFMVPEGRSMTVTVTLKPATAKLLRANRAARRVKVTAKLQSGAAATRVLTVKPQPVKQKKKRRK